MHQKRYSEIPALLEKPLSLAPDDHQLGSLRIQALLHSKNWPKVYDAIDQAKKFTESSVDPLVQNDLAFALADSGNAIALAEDLATLAVKRIEEQTARPSLSTFENSDLQRMVALSAVWDTFGWVHFIQSYSYSGSDQVKEMATAEKYISASVAAESTCRCS